MVVRVSSPAGAEHGAKVSRSLFLIWQDPESRRFVRIGVLSELVDGRYTFAYTDDARNGENFYPLAQFPDTEKTYVSTALPAFFVNRLMSRKRDSYPDYLDALGIDSPELETPMELLARTGGPRATDTFHLVDDLIAGDDDVVTSRFLASGVRHVDTDGTRLANLQDEDQLKLRAEPDNPANDRAQLICADSGEPVGYVPDWLLSDVEKLRSKADVLKIFAERVSPDAPPHLRLLCRIEAHLS